MLLEAKNISLYYIDGRERVVALNNIRLNLPETGMFGVIGPSGSGKTSLLYVLAGIRHYSSGTLLYKGAPFPVSVEQRNRIRRNEMGFVFQYHFLMNYLTVEENILVGASEVSRNTARTLTQELINKLGLQDVAHRRPFELSGGQRQRVAIGRALANKPAILFVDEPTASLDHGTGAVVVRLLEDAARNTCVLVVTHDESILRNANHVYSLWDGKLQ